MADINDREKVLDDIIAIIRAENLAKKQNQEKQEFLDRQQFERDKLKNQADQKIAEANLNTAEAIKESTENNLQSIKELDEISNISSKERKADAESDKIKAETELNKSKRLSNEERLENDKKKIELDLLKESNKLERLSGEAADKESKKMKAFAEQMDSIQEKIKGPIDNLLDSISNAVKFDIRKNQLTGIAGTAAIGLNSLATQERTPPIYGMIAKLIGGFAVSTTFYVEKALKSFTNHLLGVSKQDLEARRLIKSDEVLKRVADTNEKLALSMAHLKIAQFRESTKSKFEKERSEFISRIEATKNNTISSFNKESNNITKDFKSVSNTNLPIDKLDEIISIIKSIKNQYDPETDLERYNLEVEWRNGVLERLGKAKLESTQSDKQGFGLLQFGALAGISAWVTSVIKSISTFILPLGLLSKSMLKFAGPIGIAATALMTLDFQKDLIAPINNIIDTFKSGNIVESLTRGLVLPVELTVKFIGRTLSYLAGLFEFDSIKSKLDEQMSTLDLFKSIVIFKDNIIKTFDELTGDLSNKFSDEIQTVKDYFNNTLNNISKSFEDFNLSKSITEIFDWLSDKIESLKFWKSDKEFKTPKFINDAVSIFKSNVTDKITKNINNISKIDNVESSIKKIESSSMSNLNKTYNQIVEQKERRETTKLKEVVERTTQVITPINNTQVNNSSTAIAMRPRARIEEITGQRSMMNNNSSNFSGFIMG